MGVRALSYCAATSKLVSIGHGKVSLRESLYPLVWKFDEHHANAHVVAKLKGHLVPLVGCVSLDQATLYER